MGKRDEKVKHNEACDACLSAVAGTMFADFRLLLGQFREFAVAARLKLVAAVALLLVEIGLSLLFVFAFAFLADLATADAGWADWRLGRDTGQVAAFLAVAALLLVTCQYFERLWMVQIGERAIADLSKNVFAKIVSLPMTFVTDSRMRAIDADVVDDIGHVGRAWTHDLFSGLKRLLLILVSLILMFKVAPDLAAPLVGMMVVLGAAWAVFVWLLTKKQALARASHDLSGIVPAINEVIDGLATVKAFGNETHTRTRFRHRVEKLLSSALLSASKRAAARALGCLALLGPVVYLWWLGATAVSSERFLAGEFTAFVLLLVIAGAAVRKLAKSVCRLLAASRAARRLDALLAEPAERLDSGKFMPGSRERLDGRLNINKASFAYPDQPNQLVVDSLSLAVSPGGKIAIVGPPGSGKTALAHLILGYYPLHAGSVEIDGRSVGDYPLSWLRSQIGWVPAQTYLFSGTVAENIGYGRASASLTEIREAAAKAGALAFIEALQDGFDTALASDTRATGGVGRADLGLRLSAEQKRRIALARVFLEDPPIVFIDAPASRTVQQSATSRSKTGSAPATVSSLSEVEESLIKDRTAIVVATGLTTTRAMDKILVLRDGKVAERGSHRELYEGRGFYRLLCEGQFGKD